ncbi:hypothetical protein MBLNU230_g5359t1 [Neophaeotheca triangularis]
MAPATKVHAHHLAPTPLIPNSPLPLLHYPSALPNPTAALARQLYTKNHWQTAWIFRYGPTQTSHYHSTSHECMTVLSGTATIRFGVADLSPDMEANTHGTRGQDYEAGGVEIAAKAGDVFLIPAGVSHKTYDTSPPASFALVSPGDGHGLGCTSDAEADEKLGAVRLEGFCMLGSYPEGADWDSCNGGEHRGREGVVWDVPRPELDPVLGESRDGINGLWAYGLAKI